MISTVVLDGYRINVEKMGVDLCDHASFTQVLERLALSQPPAGTGNAWFTFASGHFTEITMTGLENIVWYGDVTSSAPCWGMLMLVAWKSVRQAMNLGELDACSFVCSAMNDNLREYRNAYSFTQDEALVGVLPKDRWTWAWTSLKPSEAVTDIQTNIFKKQQETDS